MGDVGSAKFVFFVGGVVSGVGKGLTAASLGAVLKARGVDVRVLKLDPYFNVDPGTMNPVEHGEVFVTDDGAETDLDLGHYERFLDVSLTRRANATSGSIYAAVIAKERHGDYLGRTVQVIPHITDEIKNRVRAAAVDGGVTIVEIGGTVGDIEIVSYLEAVRQFRREVGSANVFVAHMCYVPVITPGEVPKTKPTQHSSAQLRSAGVVADAIILRSQHPLDEQVRVKVANTCDVGPAAVINCFDVECLYEIPRVLSDQHLDDLVLAKFSHSAPAANLSLWDRMVEVRRNASRPVTVALVGKYTTLSDSYLSVCEALEHAAVSLGVRADIIAVDASDPASFDLQRAATIVIPGGFGPRGFDGKVAAARFGRERNVPTLGLCLGLQVMMIEFARNVLGLADASSTEMDPRTTNPVVSLLSEQEAVVDVGNTMRLGAFPAVLTAGSVVAAAYGTPVAVERHRHRWEFNMAYRAAFTAAGVSFSGISPDGTLVEFAELTGHRFYVGTQAHPEFKSRPARPHPLFVALLEAALGR